MAFVALLLTPFRGACILSNSAYLTVFPRGPHQEHQHYLMSNRSVPNLEERLKHASDAKKLMLAKPDPRMSVDSLAVHMMDNASALPTCAQQQQQKAAADQNRLEITHSIAR